MRSFPSEFSFAFSEDPFSFCRVAILRKNRMCSHPYNGPFLYYRRIMRLLTILIDGRKKHYTSGRTKSFLHNSSRRIMRLSPVFIQGELNDLKTHYTSTCILAQVYLFKLLNFWRLFCVLFPAVAVLVQS